MPEAMPTVDTGELMMCNTLFVALEHRERYAEELQKVLPLARELPGCLALEVGERTDAPGTFILTERWANGEQYINEYLALPFYQEYLTATEAMYAQPRQVQVLRSL